MCNGVHLILHSIVILAHSLLSCLTYRAYSREPPLQGSEVLDVLLKVVHVPSSIVVELFAQVIRSRRSIVQSTALYKADPPESFSYLIVLRTLLELLIQGCASVLGP